MGIVQASINSFKSQCVAPSQVDKISLRKNNTLANLFMLTGLWGWAKIIKKERQNAYKEEYLYYKKVEGGKMKEDAVSQCPSQRMDMQ